MVQAASNLPQTIFGYARVSTSSQELVGQIAELKAAGCVKIFSEKVSGAKTDRAELAKLLKRIEPGDTLIVTRLDRLARSTLDLLHTLDTVAKLGASFKSLADVWCDTSTAHGQLMLTVLSGLAQFERSLIVARTSAGRQRAKDRGVRFGRPFALNPEQRREAIAMLDAGRTQAEVGRLFGVDGTTIGRLNARRGVVHHLPVPVAAALLRTMGRR